MNRIRTILLICVPAFLAASASGYEVVEVSNGGAIKGRISSSNPSKSDETLTVSKDTEHCGSSLPAEKYLISAGGGVKNAVVVVEGIAKGKGFDPAADFAVANKNCRFVPHVSVARKGGSMKVRNEDPLLHNSHFFLVDASTKKNVINIAMPRQGMEVSKPKILRKPGLLSVECDAHDFMQGWVWVLEHPYAAVTDADGGFSLDGVPPGTYKVRVWHEALGEKTVDVTVASGKTAAVDVSY